MKIAKKFRLQILLLALMLFVLSACGNQLTTSPKNDDPNLEESSTEYAASVSESVEADLEENLEEQLDQKIDPEIYDRASMETIDALWEKLDGVWNFEEYIYMGSSVNDTAHTMEFQYIDKMPCMVKNIQRDNGESFSREEFVYECSEDGEYHYSAFVYKKDSYNGTDSPWNDDALLVWYGFDLTNISEGELLVRYYVSYESGYIDDNHLYRYQKEN